MREAHGNMIVLIAAVMCGIIMLILFFTFKYTGILGGYQEQKTAIESAALAVARDLSAIVIEDQYFGFIGLSDNAPTGTATAAKDGFYMPVEGINTILATVRLDMIIADKLENPVMQDCSRRDYQFAMQAKDNLVTTLESAIGVNGQGKDINGNTITPQADAIAAYNQCVQRMTGTKTHLVTGTLQLSLGCIPQIATNTPVPQPESVGGVATALEQNNCYLAYVNDSYKPTGRPSMDFVFAGTAANVILVDSMNFVLPTKETPTGLTYVLPGLPYVIPSIVLCQADQQFNDVDAHGRQVTRTVHATACAQPMCNIDPRPHRDR